MPKPSEGRFRLSRVRGLTECNRYGIAAVSVPWDGRIHVASWIGSSVHNRLKGQPNEPKPDNLEYDKTTSTAARADEAVEKILAAIAEFEEFHKPEIQERELVIEGVFGETKLEGVIDILARIDGRLTIIDLNTGSRPYDAWIKCALAGAVLSGSDGVTADDVALLHVPRLGPRTPQRWTFKRRPFEPMLEDAFQWAWAINTLTQAEYRELIASPGQHCSRCPDDRCTVRALDHKDKRKEEKKNLEKDNREKDNR